MITKYINNAYLYKLSKNILYPQVKRSLIRHINNIRRLRLKNLKTPETIVIYITNYCQMHCPFCFYKTKLNIPDMQMNLEEITALAKYFKNSPRIILTGGEPFLREDIDEICIIFDRSSKTKYLSINTNGFLVEKIEDKVKNILNNTKLNCLKIQISLDALGEKHDCLRGIKGAFTNAIATLSVLKKIQKKYNRLYIEIASMVNNFLIDEIKEFIEYFEKQNVLIKFSIIRYSDFGVFGLEKEYKSNLIPIECSVVPKLDKLEYFYEMTKGINAHSDYKFWSVLQQLKFKVTLNILKKGKRIFPCYAGVADAVIYNNADVAFCENTIPVGNLRDYDFDFFSLWHSKCADVLRKKTKSCFCIHGCNLLTAMSYNDEVLAGIL